MKKTLAVLILIVASLNAYPQGIFLDKGENGIETGIGISAERKRFDFGTFAACSFSSLADFSLFLGGGYLNPEDTVLEKNIHSFTAMPSAGIVLARQGGFFPLNMKVAASYTYIRYMSEEMKEENIEIDENGISAQLLLSRKITPGDSLSLYPGMSLSLNKFNLNTKNRDGDEVSDARFYSGFAAEISLVFYSKDRIYILKPALGYRDENLFSGIAFSVIYRH